jgi:hypothetical protein
MKHASRCLVSGTTAEMIEAEALSPNEGADDDNDKLSRSAGE